MLPLAGIRVVEMAGLAPVPMCGMILADFGAKVIRVDRAGPGPNLDRLGRGKQSIAVNLKKPAGVQLVRRLASSADVLLEPYRPGVMERLGLGPRELMADNPRLIYSRLTGFGQHGPLADRAGHDINYLAVSGLLSFFGRKDDKPFAPVNFAADFAGGAMTCAFGILAALLARNDIGKGQVIDASMADGAAYIGSWLWKSQDMPGLWGNPRGENLLDSGAAFYDTYKTKDGFYMSVGALEPQFYQKFREALGFSEDELPQFDHEGNAPKLTQIFATKTQQEWSDIFNSIDACVIPVVPWQHAAEHEHNTARGSFCQGPLGPEPNPAPKLSETPAQVRSTENPLIGQHTDAVLAEAGYPLEEIQELKSSGVVSQHVESKL